MNKLAFLNKDLLLDDIFFIIRKRGYSNNGDLQSIQYSVFYVVASSTIKNSSCSIQYKFSTNNDFQPEHSSSKDIKATISIYNDEDDYLLNLLSLDKSEKDKVWLLSDDKKYISAYELFSRKDSIVEIDSKENDEKISIYFNNNLINFNEWVKRSLEQEIKSEPGKNIVAYKESDIINIGRYICYDIMKEASSFKTVDELEQIITGRFSELCPRTYRR